MRSHARDDQAHQEKAVDLERERGDVATAIHAKGRRRETVAGWRQSK
jgi:hypothetical protein